MKNASNNSEYLYEISNDLKILLETLFSKKNSHTNKTQ